MKDLRSSIRKLIILSIFCKMPLLGNQTGVFFVIMNALKKRHISRKKKISIISAQRFYTVSFKNTTPLNLSVSPLGMIRESHFIISIFEMDGKKGSMNQNNRECTASNTADVFTLKKKGIINSFHT